MEQASPSPSGSYLSVETPPNASVINSGQDQAHVTPEQANPPGADQPAFVKRDDASRLGITIILNLLLHPGIGVMRLSRPLIAAAFILTFFAVSGAPYFHLIAKGDIPLAQHADLLFYGKVAAGAVIISTLIYCWHFSRWHTTKPHWSPHFYAMLIASILALWAANKIMDNYENTYAKELHQARSAEMLAELAKQDRAEGK